MTFQVLQQINGFGLMELQLKGLQIDGTAAKGSSDRLETLRCGVLCARLLLGGSSREYLHGMLSVTHSCSVLSQSAKGGSLDV